MSGPSPLPDFQAALASGSTLLYAAFGDGPFTVMPTNGTAAKSDLALNLIRRPEQPGAAGNYALLDVTVAQEFPLDAALAIARGRSPDATVKPADFDLGFARLVPGGPSVALPEDMKAPSPLGWSASLGARWTERLDVATGELIKGAILGGVSLFRARVEFTVRGVASRANVKAGFAPAALMDALLAGLPDRRIFVPELLKLCSTPPAALEITGDAPSDRIAEILVDRLTAAYGVFEPAPGAFDPPCFRIAQALPTERVVWDLAEPATVSRAFVASFDPLAGLKDIADRVSLIHEITIPPLDLGFREIVLAANLPKNRVGIPAIGARIVFPPAPPDRPSGIDTSVLFTEPEDMERVALRLGPDEPLEYEVICFAIVAAGGSVAQVEAPPRHVSGIWLQLQASDFPISLAHLTASDRLLQQASIAGALTYHYEGGEAAQPISLREGAGDIAVAAPVEAQNVAIHLAAAAPDGSTTAVAVPARGVIRLDLASFSGYGPHRIPICCRFDGGEPFVIELEGEGDGSPSPVALAPWAPNAEWGYVAGSPFHAGYRYRKQGGMWSGLLSPIRALELTADGSMIRDDPSANGGDDAPPSSFEVDGVQIFVRAGPPVVLAYIPAVPTPEVDSAGKPTLAIFKMPQATRLQLGAHFVLPPDAEAALLAKIAARHPQLASAGLQPEPINVRKAAVLLADEGGTTTELGSSPTSAFPPFAAIFSLPLSAEQAARAISALGGRRGLLFVDYAISSLGSHAQTIKRSDVATWFAGTDGLSHIRVVG